MRYEKKLREISENDNALTVMPQESKVENIISNNYNTSRYMSNDMRYKKLKITPSVFPS